MSMPRTFHLVAAAGVSALAASVLVVPAAAAQATVGHTVRESVTSAGAQTDAGGQFPAISADGRFVAFWASSDGYVNNDTNGENDVYLRDTIAGTTTLISVGLTGSAGNGESFYPDVSADGRYVAFWSNADNLVTADSNGHYDVFVRDVVAGTTERISVSSVGAPGNADSGAPVISADGRFVAYTSAATNLDATADSNGKLDIYLRDRSAATTTRLSVSSAGAQTNGDSANATISASGTRVAFESDATNLVAADTNGQIDVFLRDTASNTTSRVNVSTGGAQATGPSGNADISSDGRYVAFESDAENLAGGDGNDTGDVFLRDTASPTTTLVSVSSSGEQGNFGSMSPSVSDDGRYVLFSSPADTLVAGDDTDAIADVFQRDVAASTTTHVSVSDFGVKGNFASLNAVLSADGRHAAFESLSTNLVVGDTNNTNDIFVRKLRGNAPVITAQPAAASIAAGGSVVLVAGVSGDPVPSLQWQVSPTGLYDVWQDVDGATTAELAIRGAPASISGYRYRLVATNSLGSTTSAPAALTVTAPPTKARTRLTAKAKPTKIAAGKKAKVVITVKAAGVSKFSKLSLEIGKKTVVKNVAVRKGKATATIPARYLKKAKAYQVKVVYPGSSTTLKATKTVKVVVTRKG
jgi:Tol biopolymer transport system component